MQFARFDDLLTLPIEEYAWILAYNAWLYRWGLEITALLRYVIHMHETSNPQVDKVIAWQEKLL
jgi:hypothetical protein